MHALLLERAGLALEPQLLQCHQHSLAASANDVSASVCRKLAHARELVGRHHPTPDVPGGRVPTQEGGVQRAAATLPLMSEHSCGSPVLCAWQSVSTTGSSPR